MDRTQGASFGAGKRPEPVNSMPGPGAYNAAGEGSTTKQRPASSKPTIGSSKRPDLWNTKDAGSQGPAYAQKGAFDKPGRGGVIGKAKRDGQVAATPGPGAYADDSAGQGAKAGPGAGRIGTAKRKDHFATKEEADLPGPGNYGEAYSSFSKTQRVPIGGKYKAANHETPGPG